MISSLIVDDEILARDGLSKLISLHCKDLFVVGTAGCIEDAIDKIALLKPELVFLDIHLGNDTSFSILNTFSKIPFSIIFITGCIQHAVDAFKVDAIDYLLKPIDSEHLIAAVERYKTRRALPEKGNSSDIYIQVHHKNNVALILSSHIISLTADNNYTVILSKDGQKYTAAKTLKEFENLLILNRFFVRIHRNTLINTRFVETYSKTPPYIVVMTNTSTFEISRRKRAEVIAALAMNNLV